MNGSTIPRFPAPSKTPLTKKCRLSFVDVIDLSDLPDEPEIIEILSDDEDGPPCQLKKPKTTCSPPRQEELIVKPGSRIELFVETTFDSTCGVGLVAKKFIPKGMFFEYRGVKYALQHGPKDNASSLLKLFARVVKELVCETKNTKCCGDFMNVMSTLKFKSILPDVSKYSTVLNLLVEASINDKLQECKTHLTYPHKVQLEHRANDHSVRFEGDKILQANSGATNLEFVADSYNEGRVYLHVTNNIKKGETLSVEYGAHYWNGFLEGLKYKKETPVEYYKNKHNLLLKAMQHFN